MCRGEATTSAAECTNRREIDADEMEQGIAELEDVIARYGMLKSWFSSGSGRDITINKENFLLLLDFPMTEEQHQALGDLEKIIRRDEKTNNPHRGMSKVKYSSGEASYNDICDFKFTSPPCLMLLC